MNAPAQLQRLKCACDFHDCANLSQTPTAYCEVCLMDESGKTECQTQLRYNQARIIQESDAVCDYSESSNLSDVCSRDPRTEATWSGWFIDSVLVDGVEMAHVRCPDHW